MNISILSLFISFCFVPPARTRLETFTDTVTTCSLFAGVSVFKCPKMANGITQHTKLYLCFMFLFFKQGKKWYIASNEVMKNAPEPENTFSTITITSIITETRKCNFDQIEKAQLCN